MFLNFTIKDSGKILAHFLLRPWFAGKVMANVSFRKAEDADFEILMPNLIKFGLDDENLHAEEFTIIEVDGDVAGFGRIKPYENMYELASIGIIEKYRKKGIGKRLIKYLIDVFPSDEIWITTKKADYFKKFGFEEMENPPDEIRKKCDRICSKAISSKAKSSFMLFKKPSL